ncbi:MAG: CHAT domain-containing protein, partial [Bacteroidetes bacterium]|nr:CHAT domain-containing protein [Bacteroidota bacterium]
AGSKTIISSLWLAEDRAAYKIITSFLEKLKEGNHKSTALQEAQQNWISESDNYFSHPYFWAGFVNIGELRIDNTTPMSYYLWAVGPILILGLFILIFYLRPSRFLKPGRSDLN